MDVDDDGQRIADRVQHNDIMDTTLDHPQQDASNVIDSEAPVKLQPAPEAQPAPLPEVSAEKDEGAEQLSKQIRKTPH